MLSLRINLLIRGQKRNHPLMPPRLPERYGGQGITTKNKYIFYELIYDRKLFA